tara:strand:- start:17 stop:655 length:639 start_codon:yes stop_codon:yes gene_type:complete
MSNKVSHIRSVTDEKDIVIQNFKHTINNLTDIITNNVNKMAELNEYRKNKDIISYTEKDIDTIKSKHDKIITDMNSKFKKVNLAYNAINTVYSKQIKDTAITNRAYKIKISSLESKLYTIKNTHREEINDLQSFYKKKIDLLNENVNNLEASIRLLELKNKQSDSDITINSDEQLIDCTVDSLDVNFDEDYKLDELVLDSDNDTNDNNESVQ